MRFNTMLALGSLLAVLAGATGCDDEPTCHVLVNVSGGLAGDLAWTLSGRDQCGLADASAIGDGTEALVLIDRSGEAPLQFVIAATGGLSAVGEYTGQVLFVTPDGLWQSGADACTISVVSREHEDWSRIDFVEMKGLVDCPGGLQSATGAQAITMSTMAYSVHIHDEALNFEIL